MSEQATIFLLSNAGCTLQVDVKGLLNPGAGLSWDRNWLRTAVILEAGSFSARIENSMQISDLERLRQQLEYLYRNLKGRAEFQTLEGDITIGFTGDGLGHFTTECRVVDFLGSASVLNTEIIFDQTFIPDLIRQLDMILELYPLIK